MPKKGALECAIAPHLQRERTTPSRMPVGAPPPYPTYVGRFDPSVHSVVMCYIGVQRHGGDTDRANAARREIRELLTQTDGPPHWDESRFVDVNECENFVFAAYWADVDAYRVWSTNEQFTRWWLSDARLSDGLGYFRELFTPRVDGLETHFSTRRSEGIATLADCMSGEIREHAYWGSARDRIARAQTDPLETSGSIIAQEVDGPSLGRRVRVRPHDNACLIRSGQDWIDSDENERAVYDKDIRPHLERGMAFLCNQGMQLGCYSNRFLRILDAHGAVVDKTYAMGVWRSLGELEHWAMHHPTHLAIFSAGVAYMRHLGPGAGLRTFHEVCVLSADEQAYEYVNCHDRTGLLNMMRLTRR